MGIWSSLKGQIGRDTGKVVSNLVWKDKHASVYRRAESRKQEMLDLKKKQLETEQENQEQEKLEYLSDKVEDKIQQINNLNISENKNEIVNILNQLSILLRTNPFEDETNDDKQKINNMYSDAILIKYEQVFITYISLYPNDSRVDYYADILKSIKRFRTFKKHRIIFIYLIIIIAIIIPILISELFK